jgi:uncharacterized repeat protein (TIGR01451 family)
MAGILLISAFALIASAGVSASTASANHGVGQDPNVECAQLFGAGHIGYKIDVVSEATLDGVYNDPDSDFSVTISNTNTTLHIFDYSANIPVNVHVKGGSDPTGVLYGPPPSSTGSGLHAPVNPNNGEFYSLSHILFCWIPPDTTLSVDKTPDSQTINAGENVEFTITVNNTGNEIAHDTVLTDTLPSGTAGPWTIASQPGGDPCSITGNLLDCDFGELAAAESRTVTVSAATDYGNCAVYDNTATASAISAPDAQDTGRVTCQVPSLTVEKTPDSQTINAGDNVSFTMTVTNIGPGTATAVGLDDTLPSGTAGAWVEDPDNADCTITGGNQLSCSFGDLAANASRTVTVSAPTDYDNCAVYDNTVTVTSTNHPNAQDTGQVTCQTPSLTVEKTPDSQTINAGDNVEFTITVTNNGPGTAEDVGFLDGLPSGTAGVWTITSQSAGDPCVITGNDLTCGFGDLAANTSRTVTVSAATGPDDCAVYDNTVTVTSTNNPNAQDTGQVTCQAPSLTVTKEGNGTITAGEDVRFTIRVRNDGPGVARAVTLSDTLPIGTAGQWRITSEPAGNPCSLSGRVLSCSFGDLAPGATRGVTVKARTSAERCVTYDNTATATPTNGTSASDRDRVRCRTPKPDLKLRKRADRKKVIPGGQVAYTIWVRNSQPDSVAKNLKVCDQIPLRMTVVSAGGGNFEGGRLCWAISELPFSKEWTTFSYVARVDRDVAAGTKLRNVVTLGKKKASRTVVVVRPQGVKGVGGGQNTPVTG